MSEGRTESYVVTGCSKCDGWHRGEPCPECDQCEGYGTHSDLAPCTTAGADCGCNGPQVESECECANTGIGLQL